CSCSEAVFHICRIQAPRLSMSSFRGCCCSSFTLMPEEEPETTDNASDDPSPVMSPCTLERNGEAHDVIDGTVETSSSAPPDPSNQSNTLDPQSLESTLLSPCTLERNATARNDEGYDETHDVIVETVETRAWLLTRKGKNLKIGEVSSAVE
ncbi:unnamed protein product, partial [Ascophyllum nodosum]